MLQPVKSGKALIDEIDQTNVAAPTLWWLGHSGFIVRFANITFYIDPCLSTPAGMRRRIAAPLAPHEIRHADMIFATHAHIQQIYNYIQRLLEPAPEPSKRRIGFAPPEKREE